MFIYLKRLISSKFVRVKAFPMYGGIGVSAPSLHRESTDSLIAVYPKFHMHLYYQGVFRKLFQRDKPMFQEIEGGRRLELKYIN